MLIVVEGIRFETRLCVVGLPSSVFVEYFGKMGEFSDDCFVIFRPAEEWDYDSFRMLVGPSGERLRECKVEKVVRYRDGGTTEIKTEIGDFLFPNAIGKKDQVPTLDRMPLIMFDDYQKHSSALR